LTIFFLGRNSDVRRRAHRFVLYAAVLPVALAACGHHSATTKLTFASDSPAPTATSTGAARQLTVGDLTVRGALVADTAHKPVLDAYLAFWKAYSQASAVGDVDLPALRASMTPSGFESIRGPLSDAAAAGLTEKGPITLNPQLERTANAASRRLARQLSPSPPRPASCRSAWPSPAPRHPPWPATARGAQRSLAAASVRPPTGTRPSSPARSR
jgi:hypothetical protein